MKSVSGLLTSRLSRRYCENRLYLREKHIYVYIYVKNLIKNFASHVEFAPIIVDVKFDVRRRREREGLEKLPYKLW